VLQLHIENLALAAFDVVVCMPLDSFLRGHIARARFDSRAGFKHSLLTPIFRFASVALYLVAQNNSLMHTNRWWNLMLLLIVLGVCAVAFIGCSSEQSAANSQKATQYTCPMHPELVKDAPGDCPKCGMKLVKKT
jgi:hypothetical protein